MKILFIKRGEKVRSMEIAVLRWGTKEMVCERANPYVIFTISPYNKLDDLVYKRINGPIRVEIVEGHSRDVPELNRGFFYQELGSIILLLDQI